MLSFAKIISWGTWFVACLHDQNKSGFFWKASFYPANQSNLKSFQNPCLVGKSQPSKKRCFCFDHVNRSFSLSLGEATFVTKDRKGHFAVSCWPRQLSKYWKRAKWWTNCDWLIENFTMHWSDMQVSYHSEQTQVYRYWIVIELSTIWGVAD